MRLQFRTVQLLGFVLVVGIMGTFTTWAGLSFIKKTVLEEAKRRVELDLNAAWTSYLKEQEQLQLEISMVSQRDTWRKALAGQLGEDIVRFQMEGIRTKYGLDFLTLVGTDLRVVSRSRFPYVCGDSVGFNPVIASALLGTGVSGTILMTPELLKQEGEGLSELAYIPLIQTEMAVATDRRVEPRGMVLLAAIPVFGSDEQVKGAIYGGILLNRRFALVDRIRDEVFGDVTYEGKPVGTVTLFLWDVRIATNVIQLDNTRALGTRLWEQVHHKVLEQGERFADRAFVVNDWYLSAYDPIRDPTGTIVGIIYVGLLEKKYLAYEGTLVGQFLGITFLALLVSLAVWSYVSSNLRKPVLQLFSATRELSSGRLDARVSVKRGSKEIVELSEAFNSMADSLERRNRELNEASLALEKALSAADEKNRAYLETLGFVTHELKSPLASIVFAIASIRDGIFGALNKEQEGLLKAAANSADYLQDTIANYLNLSRIEEGALGLQLTEVNFYRDIIIPVVDRLAEMATDAQMTITCEVDHETRGVCDSGLLTSVFQNLLSNAIKYGRKGGKIIVRSSRDDSANLCFSVWNEGVGFDEDTQGKLFTRFSRFGAGKYDTKSGTGLGLFVAKQIIERHGGRIWAESDAGNWASFSFAIPANLAATGEGS